MRIALAGDTHPTLDWHKRLTFSAQAERWLGKQLMHELIPYPILSHQYLYPLYANLFRYWADRTVPRAGAPCFDKMDRARMSIKQFDTKGFCARVTIPFFRTITDRQIAERGWVQFSH